MWSKTPNFIVSPPFVIFPAGVPHVSGQGACRDSGRGATGGDADLISVYRGVSLSSRAQRAIFGRRRMVRHAERSLIARWDDSLGRLLSHM
jgi:hypothetical protein